MADDSVPFLNADFGTASLMQHWKRRRDETFYAAAATTSGRSEVIRMSEAIEVQLTGVEAKLNPTVVVPLPEMLLGAELVQKGSKTDEGDIVIAVTPIFRRFLKELNRDPNAFYQLNPRQFEELIAAGYEEAGWCDDIVLTPRSGDKGRDVIVTSKLFGTIRILDQVKLYKPNHVVEAEDVRALYGVLGLDVGASKGIITTTSAFAPGVYTEFERQMPGRISLRDGTQLREWLHLFDKP